MQKEVNSIKAEIQQIQKEIDELERSQEFRELGDKLTRTRKSLQSNVRDIKTLKQRGQDFNITETRTTIVDALKIKRPREGTTKDPVLVLYGMVSDFQTKKKL